MSSWMCNIQQRIEKAESPQTLVWLEGKIEQAIENREIFLDDKIQLEEWLREKKEFFVVQKWERDKLTSIDLRGADLRGADLTVKVIKG